MSSTWSNNPNAPQISHEIYSSEKSNFAGCIIGTILYGVVIALFFQCMTVLLGSADHVRKANRWGLLVHTAALFSFSTMSLAIGLFFLSAAYIDAREFSGVDDLPSGPYGYLGLPKFVVFAGISDSVTPVNQWLIDGLLLYRCYVIYHMNYWAVAIPFVIYLASCATGILLLYNGEAQYWGDTYYSIALSLNALLTLMLITRLVLHSKNIRCVMGDQDGASGLYKAIITMLVESGALYAASFALLVGSCASQSEVLQLIIPQITPGTQCIAPFLIVLRVANRTALTSEAVVSGSISSIRFRTQGELTGGDGSLLNGNPTHSASDAHGEAPGEHDTGADNAIERVPL